MKFVAGGSLSGVVGAGGEFVSQMAGAGKGAPKLRRSLALMFMGLMLAFPAFAQEIYAWTESPIRRTIETGSSMVLDLRDYGYGEEGSPDSSFSIVLAPTAYRLTGYTQGYPSFVSNTPASSGRLVITNAVVGTYAFTMRARHTSNPGPANSGRVGVRITVVDPNYPPVAVNNSYTQAHSTTVDHNVLSNDIDPNGDPLTLSSENSPYASVVSNKLRFAAPATPGTYPVTYTISDGRGGTASAVATITVPNVAPTAVNDSYTQARSTTVDRNVLSNDSDPNGDALTITGENSSYASIVSNKLRFAAPASPGSYPVTYTIADGRGGTASAVATITVPNAAPVAANDSVLALTQIPVQINVKANDSDSDGTIVAVAILSGPANGSALLNSDQTITYTSEAAYSGSDSFTYRVTDNDGTHSGAGTVSVTVDNSYSVSHIDYAYDALGRLKVVQTSTDLGGLPVGWVAYCYDPSGNRQSVEAGAGAAGAACE
ncbi:MULTISPECIES: Ig-like domain-containing protein [Hyphomonas]|nr:MULTISPECIES: Ig-like domain-containing protein [Hyphomonas]